jgi:hypothetical protein
MWVKNDVVEVVLLVLLVVVVELVVVVLVLVEVVVVVVLVALGVVVAGVLSVEVVGSSCCTNGSLLWKLEYLSAGETMIGWSPASATDATVVPTCACFRVLGVVSLELLPPNPMHPLNRMAHPATRSTPPRRCRWLMVLIFVVL